MHAFKKSKILFRDALRHALAATLLAFGILPVAQATIIGGSVQTGTPIAPTGDGLCSLDPSITDMNICTNGQVTYSLEFVGNGGDDPVTMTSQLPVGAVWEAVPPSCSGAGSGISADGRTLTCVYPGPVAAGTVRILPTARISGALANGSQLPAPVTTYSSPQTPAPVTATDLSGALTVRAKPNYDLIKAAQSAPFQPYPGPNGEAGYLLRYSIQISIPNGQLQGLENLTQPLVVTDAVPANASLITWGAAGPYTCHANSTDLPAYHTPNTNYLAGTGGTCSATQAGAGAPATLTLSGMNLIGNLQGFAYFVADFNLLMWMPASSLVPGNNTITNTIDWQPGSISGQPNVDPNPNNQTVTETLFIGEQQVQRGTFNKYFNVWPYNGSARLPSDATGNLLIQTQNATQAPQDKVVCEKLDNTRYQVNAPAVVTAPGAVIQYGTGGLNGAGQTWASENDQRTGTCADNQSPAWYADPNDVPGGPRFITKIRARFTAAPGSTDFQAFYRVLGAYAFNGYATNNGTAIAGQPIPVGERMINWTALRIVGADAATYNAPDDQAVQDSAGNWWGISRNPDPLASAYGDTLYVARAIAGVTKSLVPANASTIVEAGTAVTFRLQPTLDTLTGIAGTTPTTITLRDVLPPGLDYESGSSTAGEPTVQANVPSAGYTTLTWTLSGVLPGTVIPGIDYRAVVDQFVPNSRILPNFVEASSPLDPEICAASTGIYAGMLTNTVINADTGAVGGNLCARAARQDISVSNPGGLQLKKTTDTPVISANGTLQYTLTWGGIQSSVDRTDLIDVLPNNGDGRVPATNYNGGVAGSANLHLENLIGPVTNDGAPASTFYYTRAAAATIAPDPAHPSNVLPGGSTRWCTSAEFGAAGCPASKNEATAFRVVSTSALAPNLMRSVVVVLRTSGNLAGDTYTNAFTMRGTVDGQPLVALLDSNAVSAVTQAAAVTVKKVLTTGGPIAEAGETLSYTITLTNATATAATNHAFYESIPAYTTFQSVTGASVADCAAGDAGRKTCTLTVANVPANGTSEVVLTVQVASTLPAGLTQLYNLVTDGVCDPANASCVPPPACDPATDANQCIPPPTGCDPTTDPDHCVVTPVEPPNITVKKVLTTGGPIAEAGETLSYTITLTNATATAATNHAFYESIPAYTTFQSVTGASVTDCAAGDAGRKTCTLTVANVPANGTSEVVLTVQVASTLPAGLTELYNLVTDGVCDPTDTTCIPPPACDPATDSNRCIPPPTGCDPTTDPDHCVVTPVTQPNVTVKKELTAESGTRAGIAENAETLTYTLTLTNNGTAAAANHAFYERLPEYTRLVSISGAGVTHNCVAGDAGPKLCTLTVAGPITPEGGIALATVVLVTDNVLPTGVRQIFNLITDHTGTPPSGCDPATQVCTPPPVCDPATDPNQCDTPPLPGCDPATDPDHCVVTPIEVPSITVRKQLTGEDGSTAGFAEPGETLTYTLTVTNDGGQGVSEHEFFEQLPAHVTLVGITGNGVSSNCAAGDRGSKLCRITVLAPIVGSGGTASVTVVVKVADPLPAGVATLVNLVTDNTDTPPPGCDPFTQICGGDPELPPQCDPSVDPAHCVSTPVAALLTVEKAAIGVPQPVEGSGDEFTVLYTVTVRNAGGSAGQYDLSDTPQFDADASIVSAQSTRGQEAVVALSGAGPWQLADDRDLAAGASDVYTLVLRVRVAVGSSQDNDTCVAATLGNGLFNLATMTTAGREQRDDACMETPKPGTSTVLVVEKRGSVREAEMGDLVSYTIRIRNNGTGIALLPVLVDRLPAGFRLVEGSARVSGATLVSLDGSPGPVLRLTLDRIDPGAEVQVAYRVRIGVGALEGDGINRAQVECRDTPATLATKPCSNEDRWEVDLNAGVFSEEGCVVGQVFVDCNYNSIKDREELGIPGVRMYLQDGTYLISDSEGKYSYCGLRPTTHVLKVDSTTLPTRSRMVTSSSQNVGDANSVFIDLKKGELHRADFIEGSCNNEVIEQVKARKAQGEVSSVQNETGQPSLRFESKPLPQSNPPQQGTDSANQRIEQTRHGDVPAANDDATEATPETDTDGG